MGKTTEKFVLRDITNYVKMPVNAVLSVDYRAKCICVWATYSATNKTEVRVLKITDVLSDEPTDLFVGTAKTPSKDWHVYEQPNEL